MVCTMYIYNCVLFSNVHTVSAAVKQIESVLVRSTDVAALAALHYVHSDRRPVTLCGPDLERARP